MKGMIFMSPNNGKNVIDLNAVRAHKKDNREIDFTPQISSQNSRRTVNRSTTRRPTPRRRTNTSNQKRDVRNSYSHRNQKYQSSFSKNYLKLSKLLAAGIISTSLFIGGLTGYQISNHNIGSTEYSLKEYNPTELFNGTNELVKDVAEDTLFEEKPNMEDTLSDYYLESYNEVSVAPFYGSVTLQLNYINKDPRDTSKSDFIPVKVDLPKDFAKNVYLPYKDLRDTSQKATDNEKAKTSYWLKINKATNDLNQGLESYSKEADDKEYSETAQSILDDSKVKNTDDDEITK